MDKKDEAFESPCWPILGGYWDTYFCKLYHGVCHLHGSVLVEHEQIQTGFKYVKFDDVVADSTSSIVSCG